MLRTVKYGLYGAVLAGVVGGTVAWTNVDKTVTLVVDGQASTVHTTAGSVGDVLKSRGYHVGPHDLIAPATTAAVHNGSTVVYRRGRLLRMDVDNVDRDIWTTAPTVADALNQLGYTTADFTSVSRARRLPLTPTDIAVRTTKTITLVMGDTTRTVTTLDATVGQLLADLNVDADDRVSVSRDSAVADGEQLVVQQVTRKSVTSTATLPFDTTKTPDATLSKGSTTVSTPGKDGTAKVTYELLYIDGKLAGKTQLTLVVIAAPTTQVVNVGTKPTATPSPSDSPSAPAGSASPAGSAAPGTATGSTSPSASPSPSGAPSSSTSPSDPPAPTPTGSPKSIAKQLLAARGWGDTQFSCLVSLWNRESGWRVSAANGSGAYGIPQALPGSKMAAYGPDWQTNATTQIKWGLAYISGRYGTPCGAWSSWQSQGWY